MQNVNNNKLKIVQYTPPANNQVSGNTLSDSASESEDPSALSLLLVDDNEPKSKRGSFKNRPKKVLTLMSLYDQHYPPRAPHKEKMATWEKIVNDLNAAYPGDIRLHYDACKSVAYKHTS